MRTRKISASVATAAVYRMAPTATSVRVKMNSRMPDNNPSSPELSLKAFWKGSRKIS